VTVAQVRIQTLQRAGGVVAALGCLLLGVVAMTASYMDYKSFAEGGSQLERFHRALNAANAMSRERGPSNAAMGSDEGNREAKVGDLVLRRRQTDAALRRLADLDDGREGVVTSRRLFGQMTASLALGRAEVDRVVALPPAMRSGPAIESAILAMFSAADEAARLRDLIGRDVIARTPQIGADVMLATAASDLREFQGRLGSYVVMMLTSAPETEPRLRRDMDRTVERLTFLRESVSAYTDIYFRDPGLRDLISQIHADYFRKGLGYAMAAASMRVPEHTPSVGTFTAEYVPSMKTTEQFGDRIVAASATRLETLRDAEWWHLVLAGLITAITLCVIGATALVLRRRLFTPLMEAHQQIVAIANGDLTEPAVLRSAGSEMDEMFEGLSELRSQQVEKLRLERAQTALTQQLREMSQTDQLTGLPNRRALMDAAARMAALEGQASRGSALVMFDIDHFKRINDTYGHAIGDVVLRRLGEIVRPVLRPGDILARYGGEEFTLVLSEVDEAEAFAITERIRVLVGEARFTDMYDTRVTASFGIALRAPGIRADWERMIDIADRRLYIAKQSGRNCTCASDEIQLRHAG